MGYVVAVGRGQTPHQPLFRVGPAIYGHDCSVDYLGYIVKASPDDTVCVWGGKRAVDYFFLRDADQLSAAAPRGAPKSWRRSRPHCTRRTNRYRRRDQSRKRVRSTQRHQQSIAYLSIFYTGHIKAASLRSF